MKHAYLDFDEDKTKPVVIIAQSLGCQVISNYLWDAEYGEYIFKKTTGTDPDELEFLKLQSLKRLFTTGCNMPLFISGLDERVCFSPPNDDFRWKNYYDPQDVLGWPLKQLGETYKIVNDYPINAGGLLTAWNPFSHVKYWSDKNVLNPLATSLQKLLPQN